MKHCTSVLKTLFSNMSMSMGTVEKMDKYEKVVKAGEAQDFMNIVIRSWNEVKETFSPASLGDTDTTASTNFL